MRTVIQRVSRASVDIDGTEHSSIAAGLLVLAGFEERDTEEDVLWMVHRIVPMRIFPDGEGKMNLSVKEREGDILLVSQFTLHAGIKKGNRPSFIRSARPEKAMPLYKMFANMLSLELGRPVKTGEFGADMKVDLLNDGPVTICIDSRNRE